MRSLVPFVLALSAAACAKPPMVAPAPVSLTATMTPAVVVQRAAQRLVMEGFTITTSDATGGILTASLTKQGGGTWAPFIACNFGDTSGAHTLGHVTLVVRLTAQTATTGSAVYMATDVNNGVAGQGMLSFEHTTDCASTGEIEKRIAAALAT